MNPLVNTDVNRYVKDLIDRHIPNESREDKAGAGKAEEGGRRSGANRPADVEERR